MTRSSAQSGKKVAASCLIVFAALLLAMVILELIMVTAPGKFNLEADFLQKSNLQFIMPYFLVYLVIGGLGLIGVVGLVQTYGASHHVRLTAKVVQLAALAYFAINYWLWSAMWIVQHKITLLTSRPTAPEEWVLHAFDAADAFWSLAGWGGVGPSILLFGGLALLMMRGVTLLPKAAAGAFAVAAIVQLISLIYVGLRGVGVTNQGEFSLLLDVILVLARISAFLLAGAALYSEKGVFVRTDRA